MDHLDAGEHAVRKVRQHCEFVARWWPDLREARHPGTRRRWVQSETRAESRMRATRSGDGAPLAGLGQAPAPVLLDVLDVADDVHAVAAALAVRTARALALAVPTGAGVPELLRFTVGHLAAVADGDPDLVVDALDLTTNVSILRARRRVETVLGLSERGVVLEGAECPWCGSGPLRVEVHADEPLVVCRSRRVCEPPEADCGTWVRDRPAWIEAEWTWLAKRIRHAEERVAATVS